MHGITVEGFGAIDFEDVRRDNRFVWPEERASSAGEQLVSNKVDAYTKKEG